MFLRKSRIEPLPVTMSAVRMGERVLQIGVDDPAAGQRDCREGRSQRQRGDRRDRRREAARAHARGRERGRARRRAGDAARAAAVRRAARSIS